MAAVILSTDTFALILALGIVIEFFAFLTRGGFISPFIHFIGLTWFFVWGTQTAAWSQIIGQLISFSSSNTLLIDSFPNQPFILIFPFMTVICLAGMLEAIGDLIYGNRSGETSRPRSVIAGRNANRGL